ncbi:unnamed protein product [Medioppia subpectinata]|uniref:Target of rapamycin complex 2 subunit MAPKAP1 n=1 Tax=Medioppia subpectinata TaxID=1979941 RepID=A0A7R9KT30_9ACAR|nr:unnamed protein product [Medioppia subpectinata]CAG2109000.1 unnamed protein product [Medioppia subpectinata]
MAFYDDKRFILSHIRHSFITCDDTGMCEMVMLNESIRNKYLDDEDVLKSLELETKSELSEAAQSYDIMSDMELIGVRRRSNTAQRLERLKKEKKSQAKVRTIPWKTNPNPLSESEINELFPKKELSVSEKSSPTLAAPTPKKSALTLQLESCPDIPNNPFNEFARFDGRVSEGAPIKRITIYLTMLSPQQRQHPMEVVTQINARVDDLIGLICWQYTNEGKEPRLKANVSHYSLRIAEENGEVDADFPSLNSKELVAKFGFPVLALVEKDEHENNLLVTIFIDEVFSKIQVNSLQISLQEVLDLTMRKRRPSLLKGINYKLEKRNEPGVPLDLKQTLADCNSLEFVLVPDQLLGTARHHTHHTVPKKRSRHHKRDLDYNESRTAKRIELDMSAMEAPLYRSYNVTAINKLGRTADVEMVVYWNGDEYKHWTFEAETSVTNEILKKLHFVMKMKTSLIRNEYFALKEHKHLKK